MLRFEDVAVTAQGHPVDVVAQNEWMWGRGRCEANGDWEMVFFVL